MPSKLKMTEYLEETILGKRASQERRMAVEPYEASFEEMQMAKVRAEFICDYRFRIGARVMVPEGSSDAEWNEARKKVIRFMMREMFGDFIDELIDFRNWAFENNVGRDVEDRLTDLIALASGDNIDQVKAERRHRF